MYTGDTLCHSSSCEIRACAQEAFDYLSDGAAQGEWALGSMKRRRIDTNLYSGISIFDNAKLYVRIDADADRFIIFYHVGQDVSRLQPRNVIRIVPGSVIGMTDEICLVTLLSWRDAGVDENRWKLTCVSHETEMFIIKNRIEQRANK